MKRILLIIGILIFLQPLMAQAADLQVDAQNSSITFLSKTTTHDFRGKAGKLSGQLVLNADHTSASGRVDVDVLGISTGDNTRDANMYKMFAAALFPAIVLDVNKVDIVPAADGTEAKAVLHGVLTMHGIHHDVTIPAHVTLDHGRNICAGSFSVSLKAFDLHAPSFLFIKVADPVQVDFSIVFKAP